MAVNFIDPKVPQKVIMIKGTSGGARNRMEYICTADPGASTSAPVWRLSKLIYDSSGFNTQVLFASGDSKFDKIQTGYAGYTYS